MVEKRRSYKLGEPALIKKLKKDEITTSLKHYQEQGTRDPPNSYLSQSDVEEMDPDFLFFNEQISEVKYPLIAYNPDKNLSVTLFLNNVFTKPKPISLLNYLFDKLESHASELEAKQVLDFNKMRIHLIDFYKQVDPDLKYWSLINCVEIENLKMGWGSQFYSRHRMAFGLKFCYLNLTKKGEKPISEYGPEDKIDFIRNDQWLSKLPFSYSFALEFKILQKPKSEVIILYGNEFTEETVKIPNDLEKTSEQMFISIDNVITHINLVNSKRIIHLGK